MSIWLLHLIFACILCYYKKVTADAIRGVNLGGWLLTEEWITPSLFRSTGTEDEWHLCNVLGKEQCRKKLEKHWRSFFTRDDFEDMAEAGLNAVRIPIGYWAVDVRDDEPYVSGQYPYMIQAVQWAREVGFQVMIDLHGAPGSQNGQDNSGLIGPVLFPSNTSNADRSLNVLRNISAEFSRDVYGGAVTTIELLNEPRLDDDKFPMPQLENFYAEAAETVRDASSDLINVVIHDAFWGPTYWSSTSNSTTPPYTLDTHQYYAFPPLANLSRSQILSRICDTSQTLKNSSLSLPVLVGEFSLETNSSPQASSPHAGPSQEQRTWYRLLFEAQAAAYAPQSNGEGQPILGWYFWTWKTEWEIDTWSYRRGRRDGWIPEDVGNASTYAFPVLENGCVDAQFGWTAPEEVGGAERVGGVGCMGWWVVLGTVLVLSTF